MSNNKYDTYVTSYSGYRKDKDIKDEFTPEERQEIESICGRYAGICYSDKDFSSIIEDNEKSKDRFDRVAINMGHPISEHGYITVVFEHLSKMQAIILNSYGFYSASERSARYTDLSKDTTMNDSALYTKWLDICKEDIKANTDETNDKKITKLAQENARYMVSVFAKYVTLAYTTNFRMWNNIYQDLKQYLDIIDNAVASGNYPIYDDYFHYLKEDINNLIERLESTNLIKYGLKGFKSPRLKRVFSIDKPDPRLTGLSTRTDFLQYIIAYPMSFATFAQEERHRTIHHKITLPCLGNKLSFFTPTFLSEEHKKEWSDDISNNKLIPQAIHVVVTEYGTMADFEDKCIDRISQSAQYEIRTITADNYKIIRGQTHATDLRKENLLENNK